MTAEEFIDLPKEDGWHYELTEGRTERQNIGMTRRCDENH